MNLLKAFIKKLLEEPEANSRFVFLCHGIAGALAVVIAASCFLLPHFTEKAMIPDIMYAGGAVGIGGAAGRWATKKVGPQGDNGPDSAPKP